MKKIKTCYREDYHAETPTQSMKKLKPVAQAVRSRDLATIMDGGNGDDVIPKLMKLHDPAYVEAFNKGEGVLASSQGWAWTPDIRQGVLAINQGMLTAARTALGDGIAESRPPKPTGMAPMAFPKDDGLSFEMAARRPMPGDDEDDDDSCVSLLRDDDACENYEFEGDEDDVNPFQQRPALRNRA